MLETVPARFADIAQAHAQRRAVVGERGEEYTYEQLDRLRIEAARALLAHGVRHGERVAVWAPNCVEWIVLGLAIHSIGAIVVPVSTRMRGREAAYVLERSGARLLFCCGTFLDVHYPTLLAPHRPAGVEAVVVMAAAGPGEFTWTDFLQRAAEIPADAVHQRAAAVAPDDIMDVLFTSGTTGQPKGVLSTHRQNLQVIAEFSRVMRFTPDDRYLVINPFFHVFGYRAGWLAGLLAGMCVLPHAVFDAHAVMKRIPRDRISVLPGPPTLFVSLLAELDRGERPDLSSLRATITGASAIAPALIRRIHGALGFEIVLTAYGLTEACGFVSMCEPGDDAETVATTCGRPLRGTEVRCVSPDGHEVPTGSPGEIIVRGYNVMQGYMDDPGATRYAITADGWLHTGDIGLLDERGYLRVTDRLKDMYIAGGFNCYPAEIERLIAEHEAVAQVAVVGVPDARLGEVGRAFVVLARNATLDAQELIAWCRDRMSNYKVPRYVTFVDALPLAGSGKVLKQRLRELPSIAAGPVRFADD
jgi:acyl-CoA synthetase (AMP-forming)/AMP-acid ligase II